MTLELTPECIIKPEMNENRLRKIGEVAKESSVSIDTIRYYEKEGLIQKALRSEGGFRLYGRDAVSRLAFIRRAQHFGFTLNEIKQIMRQSRKGLQPCCNHVNKLLQSKLEELEGKIAELQTTKRNLKSLIKGWIPPEEAKKQDYAVCPQIEKADLLKGGKENAKKNG